MIKRRPFISHADTPTHHLSTPIPAGIEDLNSKLDSATVDTVYTFSGVVTHIPESAEQDSTALRGALATARVIKQSGEIEMIRAATDITAEEHMLVMRGIKCGNYESDAESLFRYIGHNYGARFQSYGKIPLLVGTSIFHSMAGILL